MKARTVLRMLRTGEVYETRSVLLLPMARDVYHATVEPLSVARRVWCVKSSEWYRGSWELLVKVFWGEPAQTWRSAREIAAVLRRVRRAGVSLRGLKVMPYRHREPKGWTQDRRVVRSRRS